MCRFATYIGPEIFISSLVTQPKHSIIHQSYQSKEREEPLNGDGFGIAWFAPQFCDEPAVFKEITPAWNNQNLKNISKITKSSCILAHVRAATVGGEITRSNCHPFSWRHFAFMHNGTIFGFDKILRKLRESLSDESYSLIHGNTDTEHIFALFVESIQKVENPSVDVIAHALVEAIRGIEQLKKEFAIDVFSTMNLVVTDGKSLVASKYVTKGGQANSLYYSTGKYQCRDGICFMEECSSENTSVLIASEPFLVNVENHRKL